MRKINVLEVNNVDTAGGIFNGYTFLETLDKDIFDVNQIVIHKLSQNEKVNRFFNAKECYDIYNKLIDYEEQKSIHNIFSITTPCLINSPEYKKADIIHFHMFHNSKLSIPILKKIAKEKKVVISLHDPWFITGKCVHFYDCSKWQNGCNDCSCLSDIFSLKEDNANRLWNIKKDTFKDLDIDLVVPSKWMFDLVKKSPILNNIKNVHIIPFGININKIDKIQARKHFNISAKDKVIFLRAQKEFKGTEYVLEALKLYDKCKNLTILTCDQKDLLNPVKDKFNIIDLEYISEEDVEFALSACDIFLSPSKAESFGVMLVKSMMHGKPVVVFNNTAMPVISNAPTCGYLVEDKDVVGLKNAIYTLLNDKNEYDRRSKLCEKYAFDNYKFDIYIKNIETFYKQVYLRKHKKNNFKYKKQRHSYNIIKKDLNNFIKNNNSKVIENSLFFENLDGNSYYLNNYIYRKYCWKDYLNKKLNPIKERKNLLKEKLKRNKYIYKFYTIVRRVIK